MNKIMIIGRLTADPELKQTLNGKSVCNFAVAVNDGKEYTYFFDCVSWGNTAQNICTYFRKGSQIAITGKLTSRINEYNGQKKKLVEINVAEFDFIGSKSDNNYNNDYAAFNPPVAPKFEEIDADDSLPF